MHPEASVTAQALQIRKYTKIVKVNQKAKQEAINFQKIETQARLRKIVDQVLTGIIQNIPQILEINKPLQVDECMGVNKSERHLRAFIIHELRLTQNRPDPNP